MPCQLDPLIKKLLDSVMKAIFDLEVTPIDWVVTKGPIFQKYGTVKPVLNRTIMGQTFFGIQRCSVYTD
jgi:hypothetical protein